MDNNKELKNKLYNSITTEFNKRENTNIYSNPLPNNIEKIKDTDEFLKHGHPISWKLSGVAGIHAFVIGKVNYPYILQDDNSEQNYYPPKLIQTLSYLGSEYIYSQIAIALVDKDVPENILDWLNDWKDDTRYFRKIIFDVSDFSGNVDELARELVDKFLLPWQSIKLSPVLNDTELEIFNEGDEEEEDEW